MIQLLKRLAVLASIAALPLSMTAIASAATTVTLGSSLASAPQTLAATSQLSCATSSSNAALDGLPFVHVPTIASARGDSGTSIVQIDLRPDGTLAHYALAQSSGNSVLDDSAVRTARMTRYQPEIQNCTAVAGSYLLYVVF